MIGVLLVDDHALVRAGLIGLIDSADGMRVVGAVADGSAALEAVGALDPDIVLMDLSMPVMDGIAATRALRDSHPDVKVVALTSFGDEHRVLDVIDAGAVGYVLKDSEPEDLLRAVRAAARGEAPIDPRVAGALLRRGAPDHRREAGRSAEGLTPREREVLSLLSRGMANKQIARRLGISERTVKAHLTSVFQRIGVADRTAAALWAHRHLS